jgi:CheY-like chemotaxis protein
MDVFIGKRLRESRNRRGLTLIDVGDKLGVSYQQVQKYEQAASKISASMLHRVLSLYEVDIGSFFDDVIADGDGKFCSRSRWPCGRDGFLNLLIVEDNPGDEAITRSALSEFDLNILCVHDTTQMLQVLRYRTLCTDFPRPDLIFLDIYLPKCDGIRVMKDVKRDASICTIPIVVITSSTKEEHMKQAYCSGAAGYICKSPKFDLFKDNVASCIKYWAEAVVLPSRICDFEAQKNREVKAGSNIAV